MSEFGKNGHINGSVEDGGRVLAELTAAVTRDTALNSLAGFLTEHDVSYLSKLREVVIEAFRAGQQRELNGTTYQIELDAQLKTIMESVTRGPAQREDLKRFQAQSRNKFDEGQILWD